MPWTSGWSVSWTARCRSSSRCGRDHAEEGRRLTGEEEPQRLEGQWQADRSRAHRSEHIRYLHHVAVLEDDQADMGAVIGVGGRCRGDALFVEGRPDLSDPPVRTVVQVQFDRKWHSGLSRVGQRLSGLIR